jgi:hemerythrin superfamily protein
MPTKKASPSTARGTATRAKTTAATRGRATKKAAARRGTTAKKAAAKRGTAAKRAVAKRTPAARSTGRKTAARTSASRGDAQDALSLLTKDHRDVDELFRRFEATGPRAKKERRDLVDRMIEALSAHAGIEETVFYPAVRAEVANQGDEVLEALEEHHLVKWTLSELERMAPDDERYAAKVAVLMENVRHHVEEEEKELFPAVRKALGAARLRELGAELIAARPTAPTRPHPRSPDTPPGNVVAQAVVAPFDAAANMSKATARRVRSLVT